MIHGVIRMSYARMKQAVPESVGIDIGKKKIDVAILFSDGTTIGKVFPNTKRGISDTIRFLKKQKTADTVPCVLEATGDYHLLPALMLSHGGFRVNCINPLITKKYQRSSVRNAKTDTIDAIRLARIGLMEPDLPVFKAEKHDIASRKLVASLAKLETMKQQLSAHVKQLRAVQSTLDATFDFSLYELLLDTYDRQIASLRAILRTALSDEDRAFAEQTKGVSENQIAVLSCLLAGKDFENRDQLVAFVGLDVMPRSSGMWQGKGRLSKRGNAYARKILYQIAWGLKVHNAEFQEYYRTLRDERKKHYTTCLIAVARKFLRQYHATVLRKTAVTV